jgi:segregation and condensation protein B
MDLSAYIESILFFKGTPVSVSYLSKVLGKKEEEIETALETLEAKLDDRGLVLTRLENKVSLGTSLKSSGFIETLIKEDLSKDIGKAGLETLSIIIYRGPISRGEIDYIRGVNSSFILRNLLIRGLIEKVKDTKDQRVSMYNPTFKLLSFLGIKNIKDMPKYMEVKNNIEDFEKEKLEGDELTEEMDSDE